VPRGGPGMIDDPVAFALNVRDVAKSYGEVCALTGVTLSVKHGEILGLLGPNGAGKTSLISLVTGLRMPDRGTIEVCGLNVRAQSMAARRLIGVAAQDLSLYGQLSVGKNLTFFATLAGLAGKERAKRICDVTADLGIDNLVDKRVRDLSGGEKRRVHIGVALIAAPALLVLDEPTAGVDVETRVRVLEIVRELAAAGTSVCYATHYLEEVEMLKASVAILEQGRVMARGGVEDLVTRHAKTIVEVVFDCPAPPHLLPLGRASSDGKTLYIEVPGEPTTAIMRVAESIGSTIERVVALDVKRPSLETVYLKLTGRRFAATDGRMA
jgi:ABC-2 type transport system ATP-binding protein